MPNDMDIGAPIVCKGTLIVREHVVEPVSSLKVGFGKRAVFGRRRVKGQKGGR